MLNREEDVPAQNAVEGRPTYAEARAAYIAAAEQTDGFAHVCRPGAVSIGRLIPLREEVDRVRTGTGVDLIRTRVVFAVVPDTPALQAAALRREKAQNRGVAW